MNKQPKESFTQVAQALEELKKTNSMILKIGKIEYVLSEEKIKHLEEIIYKP